MQVFRQQLIAILMATVTLLSIVMPSLAQAAEVKEQPSAGAMVADAIIARPLLLVTTVIGTAFYVVTLPFSLLGGNAMDAGDTLVVQPAKATFVRCLGCSISGRQIDFSEDEE